MTAETRPLLSARPGTPIILCADDYGLAPGVSRGIRELIAAGRLSATSCMAGSPHWAEAAEALKPLRGLADIGLHLTLTDQKPLTHLSDLAPHGRLPPLGELLKRAVTGRIDKTEVAREFEAQFDAFEAAWGAQPDFLDGHHHVHQLPVVREVTLDLFRRRLDPHKAWVRCCFDPLPRLLKRRVAFLRAAVISRFGAPFRKLAQRQHVPLNASFAGVYDLTGRLPYPWLFEKFVAGAKPRALVMCHPGLVDDELRRADSLTDQREVEYRFLLSDAFPALLAGKGLVLSRYY